MTNQADDSIIDQVLAAEASRLQAIDDRADTGRYEDKASNMATLQASPRSYKRRNLKVRPYGDAAVMTGEIDITVDALPDGTPERHIFSFTTQVWVFRDGRWQMAAFQATMLVAKN
jgi:hypothetical protein